MCCLIEYSRAMADPTLRASHDDRVAILRTLEQHTVAGRLSLTEFDQRTASALAAVTLDDLSTLTADLPDLPAPSPEPEPAGHSHYLALVFLIAFGTVALLLAILLLRP